MELPIGEYFEAFIDGLKTQLGGFFDAVSHTIDFAITLLEHVFSLDPQTWYSSPIVFLIISALVAMVLRKWLSWRLAAPLAAALLVALLVSDFARRATINETVSPTDATLMVDTLEGFRAAALAREASGFRDNAERTLDRLISRFEGIDSARTKQGLLSERSFERSMALLAQAEQVDGEDPAFAEILATTRSALRSYSPNRLGWYAWLMVTIMMILLAYVSSGQGLALFTLLGMSLIQSMGFWSYTTDTLALVLSATGFALLIGVPLGIAAAANKTVDNLSKPVLDFMQTMPAFVYLIPAVLLFGLGKVPGAMATLIFAMPPAVRLTSLGIRSVPTEVVEAAQSFGSTPMQLLFKAQLPIALPTILAGLNQTIMLSLSMVVIGGMIGAGGLGEVVLSGITQLKIGLGFESGLSVVILAIFLDRLTQSLGNYRK